MQDFSIRIPDENRPSYHDLEINYIMTDSVCFFLIQSYLPEQEKMDQLKNELLSLNCTLQRISGISLSKAKNKFFFNSG